MLTKQPKPATYKRLFATGLRVVLVAEAITFAVSYGVWYKLNTERDFRLLMKKNCSWVLEGYYTVGETIADIKTRELDHKVWTQEGKI